MNLAQVLRHGRIMPPGAIDPPGKLSISEAIRFGKASVRVHERVVWMVNETRSLRKLRTKSVRDQVLQVMDKLKRGTTKDMRCALWSVDAQVVQNVVGQLAMEGLLKVVGKQHRFLIYEVT